MKKLFILGSLSFAIAFSLGLIVEKNMTKSAFIGAIATLSTVGSTFVLDKKSQRELKDTHNTIKNQVLMLENKEMRLSQLIESKTKEKIAIEQEYNSIFEQINTLKQEINALNLQRDNLQREISNLQNQSKGVKIPTRIEISGKIKTHKNRPMYNYIIEGLKHSGDFYNPKIHGTFEQYLQSLQTTAEQLWDSFRERQIKVSYAEASTQAVYLIRYYPHYAYMDLQILRKLHEQNLLTNLTNEALEVCFIGAGPCPEIVGLSKFLSEQYQDVKSIVANVYDIASQEWTLSLNITKNFVLPKYWTQGLSLNSYDLDLCKPQCFQALKATIKRSKLFIFQNCLNEIFDQAIVQDNLNFLFNEVSLGTIIIIIDLPLRFQKAKTIINKVADQISNRNDFEVYYPQDEAVNIESYSPIPPIIKQNLLTGKEKLIPRGKKTNCLFISLRKIK